MKTPKGWIVVIGLKNGILYYLPVSKIIEVSIRNDIEDHRPYARIETVERIHDVADLPSQVMKMIAKASK